MVVVMEVLLLLRLRSLFPELVKTALHTNLGKVQTSLK